MSMRPGEPQSRQAGFTLAEVLIVLVIISILSTIMIVSVNSSRRAGLANQGVSSAQQSARLISTLLERDVRDIGGGLYSNAYRSKNGGEAGELIGSQSPDQFDYELDITDLEGFMIPPMEVINGTDDDPASYLNPLAETINLTNGYRAHGSDVLTTYAISVDLFGGVIDDYTGLGQENFVVSDPVLGQRLVDIFERLGSKPLLIFVIDDEGTYATLRTITNIATLADDILIKMEPSNAVNQPTNFKGFLEDIGYNFNVPGGPELLRQTVTGDSFGMISAVTYFVYSHPDPSLGADGWLVRLDIPSIIAAGLDIDATDPDTLRPFVLAEHVVDFQVALGIDSDHNGILDHGEWRNSEDMEDYTHVATGEGSISTEFSDLVNYLVGFRVTVVTRTDNTSADDPYGFMRRDAPAFDSTYPGAAEVAAALNLPAQIEDHSWDRGDLLDRVWYHRAVSFTRSMKIRNLNLANTFARTQ